MQRSTLPCALIMMLLLPGFAGGQSPSSEVAPDAGRLWIFFADKGLHDASERAAAIDALASEYTAAAVKRRQQRRVLPGLFDERDLPVSADYIAAVESAGAKVHVKSRWLNAASASVNPGDMEAIVALPFVRGVRPVRHGQLIEPTWIGSVPAPSVAGGFYGAALDQLEAINLPALHDRGATGDGIVVGVLDTGFQLTHEAFNHPDHPLEVVAAWDFIDDDPDVGIEDGDPLFQHNHGTIILGTMAAYWPGILIGGAYDAEFILCKTEDTTDEYPAEEDDYVAGLEFIEMHGADVATSSLGYIQWYEQSDLDGATAVTTLAVNIATANGMVCCTAAGNAGHDDDPDTSHLLAPADALEVLACGAINLEGELPGFTSDGPSADGRVKPEVLAPGVSVVSVNPLDDQMLTDANGTSLATPLVAAAAACLLEARPTWSVQSMRTMLFESASIAAGQGGFDPLYVQGYGLIDAFGAASLDCNGNGTIDADDIASGSSSDDNGNGSPDECDADLDGDGSVDVQDLVQLIAAWGPCPPDCPADLDGDGTVGVGDLVALIVAWG